MYALKLTIGISALLIAFFNSIYYPETVPYTTEDMLFGAGFAAILFLIRFVFNQTKWARR